MFFHIGRPSALLLMCSLEAVINNFYGGASPASVRRVEDNVPAEPAPEDAPFKELSASLEKELEILIKDFMSNAYDRLAPVSVP